MPPGRSIGAGVLLALSVVAPSGCMTGGAAPLDEDFYGDLQCPDTSSDSPTDMACHDDCQRDCGFNAGPNYPRGVKYCVCQSGVYIECRCPRADWYKGELDAPYCDDWTTDGSGKASSIKAAECDREFKQCITRDPVDGFTPRGCVCIDKEGRGQLQWVCASTEKWFYPKQ
jgi:hypothetical protein